MSLTVLLVVLSLIGGTGLAFETPICTTSDSRYDPAFMSVESMGSNSECEGVAI